MIRILVADDHPTLRAGLRRLLDSTQDFDVVGEAGNVAEVARETEILRPDVVVLDLSMPTDDDGIRALQQIHDKTQVLVFSMHSEDQFARRVLREGAMGYLNKKAAPDEIERAIRQIHGGDLYVSPSFAGRLAAGLVQEEEPESVEEILSTRELQVFKALGAGRPQTEIGEDLGISVKTVSTHRTRILQKLGLHSTAELIHYAISHGIASPGDADS